MYKVKFTSFSGSGQPTKMAPRICGFAAVRCILVLLNSVYVGISLFLVGLVVAARTLAYNYTNVQILIGVGVVAGFLFIVAVLGLVGTLQHNQIAMFFYMVLLGLSGMALFLVSVVALSIPVQFQESMFLEAWEGLSTGQKADVQDRLGCCGFNSEHEYLVGSNCTYGHPLCNSTELQNGCCKHMNHSSMLTSRGNCMAEMPLLCPDCNQCFVLWESSVSQGLKVVGSLGLIFSFTQIAGIILTFRYRNLKDPNVNPGDFL